MIKYILVNTSFNWADEFDLEGAYVIDREAHDSHMAEIKKYFDEGGSALKCCFGSNQWVEIDSFEGFRSGLLIRDLTAEEYDTFMKFGGSFGRTFGTLEVLDKIHHW